MFTRDTGQPLSCTSLRGEKYNSKQKLQAHQCKLNFVEVSDDNLCLAQFQGTEHGQEDRISAGYMPKEYFAQEESKRRELLKKCIIHLQDKLTTKIPDFMHDRGATAMNVLTDGEIIDISYLGDCETFLLIEEKGQIISCELLNPYLHNVSNEAEKQRVQSKNEKPVIFPDNLGVIRLGGLLLLTRALGNNRMSNILSREADVVSRKLALSAGQTAHLIVASDGLTQKAKGEQHAEFVRTLLKHCADRGVGKLSTHLMNVVTRFAGKFDDISFAHLILKKGMRPTYVNLFDGHGGWQVSDLALKVMPEVFAEVLGFQLAQEEVPSGSESTPPSQEPVVTQPLTDNDQTPPDSVVPTKPAAKVRITDLIGRDGFLQRQKSKGAGDEAADDEDQPEEELDHGKSSRRNK